MCFACEIFKLGVVNITYVEDATYLKFKKVLNELFNFIFGLFI